MNVAQRGTSSTSSGMNSVDRFSSTFANTGNTVTQAQVDVASGTTPYTLGFRKALKISMSGAGTVNSNSYIDSFQKIEAQNVATSGWNYLSSSSNITVSFWVKVSTNQTFYARLFAADTTNKTYCFSYTASGNNTWTKITKTIPGDSNLVFNTDVGEGLRIQFYQFYGTDYTGSRNLDTWEAAGSAHSPDQATTWYTAGASTWEMTGLQVEVGSVATDFEHRTLQEEYLRCLRYYQVYGSSGNGNTFQDLRPIGHSSGTVEVMTDFRGIPMRTTPTVAFSGDLNIRGCASTYADNGVTLAGNNFAFASDGVSFTGHFWVSASSGSPFAACQGGRVTGASNGAYIEFKAEL